MGFDKNRVRMYGPAGGEIATCSFSLVTTALTTVEAQGCSVARTGTGTYVVTLDRKGAKAVTVGMSVQAASTAQLFIVTARDLAAGTITLKQVTAGSGTAVDTITAQIDLVIALRVNA